MTTTLTRDRAYLRMCDNDDLIRLADDSHDELALVLAERLAEAGQLEEECGELQYQLDQSTALVDRLRDDIQDLAEAGQLEEECGELQYQLDQSTALVDRLRDDIQDLEDELERLRNVIDEERRA